MLNSFSSSDREILAQYWHPVCWTSDLGEKPLPVVLLDTSLVIYRTDDDIVAAIDRCPHRGAKLSGGEIEKGRLVCPYHGLEFAEGGACVHAAGTDSNKIPKRLNLQTFPIQIEHGLVWVMLGDDRGAPLPIWEELYDEAFQTFPAPPFDCEAGPTRFCENFNDVVHFSWVHSGTFGQKNYVPELPYEFEETKHGLKHNIVYRQTDRTDFESSEEETTNALYSYDFTFPFANHMCLDFGSDRVQHIFAVASPVSAETCRLFFQFGRNYDQDKPIQKSLEFEVAVCAEDLGLLKDIFPKSSPLDIKEEVHLVFDKWSSAYRRRLYKLGLRN